MKEATKHPRKKSEENEWKEMKGKDRKHGKERINDKMMKIYFRWDRCHWQNA